MDALRKIADAVLYEGYVLWPYRRSALKNQQRFTFGGVYPRAHSEGREDDPCTMRTECLVEDHGEARVEVRVRFLHVVRRDPARRTAAGLELVDELTVDGKRHLAWDEAAEREVVVPDLHLDERAEPWLVEIAVPAGRDEEPLGDSQGVLVRRWEGLSGSLEITAEAVRPGLFRLALEIANTSPCEGGSRGELLRRTFCSTHTTLQATGGAFVSLTDPPEELRKEAAACANRGTWPVLVGDEGERHTLLSSPIILSDYPQIAPESPGDLFDGVEIDQLLVLNILALTEEEKAEMRDSDPKAREILERTAALSDEQLMRLHGAIRELRTSARP
jgi:hydrogenase maturation protease